MIFQEKHSTTSEQWQSNRATKQKKKQLIDAVTSESKLSNKTFHLQGVLIGCVGFLLRSVPSPKSLLDAGDVLVGHKPNS